MTTRGPAIQPPYDASERVYARFRTNLRAWMVRARIADAEALARKTGWCPRRCRRLVDGTTRPSLADLVTLGRALSVSPGTLAFGPPPP